MNDHSTKKIAVSGEVVKHPCAHRRTSAAGSRMVPGVAPARRKKQGGDMKFDPILPEPRVQAMRKQRYWGDELLVDYLDRCIAQAPDKTAILDFNSMQGTEHGLSYREFGGLVDRIAVG